MYILDEARFGAVCGGTAKADGGDDDKIEQHLADVCHGLPDSAKVKISASKARKLGGSATLGFSSRANDSTSVTLTCGAFRKYEAEKKKHHDEP